MGTDRLPMLDALRGLALLGIAIANFPYFAKLHQLSAEQLAAFPAPAWDRAVTTLRHGLVAEKFASLFALLFGIGFGLQALRASAHEADFRRRHRDRVGWLFVIGALHALFWIGDILVLYALVGLLLPLFLSARPRTLLISSAVAFSAPIAVSLLAAATHGRSDLSCWLLEFGHQLEIAFAVSPFVGDRVTFREHFLGNVAELFLRYGNLLATGRPFKVLGMFLLGLWIVRSLLLFELDRRRRLLRRVVAVGLLAGLPFNFLLAEILSSNWLSPHGRQAVLSCLYAGGVIPLSLAYAAGFALCWQRLPDGGMLRRLAPVGRLALTNYLTQTVVGISLFYGIGCGWAGRVGASTLLLLALAVFAAQMLFSDLWLRRFSIGPCEWVWRRLAETRPKTERARATTPVALH